MDVILSEYEKEHARLRLKFHTEVDPITRCWNWQARVYESGYGQFWLGKTMKASRASYYLFKGEIPDGLHVLHTCHNRRCVNPDHLYAGTHTENMIDRERAGHTSRGEHRYNYKRNADLLKSIKDELLAGLTVREAANKLGIGWQTIYRARNQDADLRAIMIKTKSGRYSRGALKRERS